MEWLKPLSILLPILVVLSGSGIYLFNWYIEPNFTNGQYYTNAWIEYGLKQNTLNIEYVPDGHGSLMPAMAEALYRVHYKSEINSKIDGKPILIILWVRYNTELLAMFRLLVTGKELEIIQHGSTAERMDVIDNLGDKVEYLYNKSQVMIERDGKVQYVPYNSSLFTANAAIDRARQYHIDDMMYTWIVILCSVVIGLIYIEVS